MTTHERAIKLYDIAQSTGMSRREAIDAIDAELDTYGKEQHLIGYSDGEDEGYAAGYEEGLAETKDND